MLTREVRTEGEGPSAQPPPPPERAGFSLTGDPVQGALVKGLAPSGTAELLFDGRPVPFDTEGRFILGLDRDQGPAALLSARLAGGRTIDLRLAVAPRTWRIERVDAPLRPAVPAEQYRAQRERELARIAAARAIDTGSQGWRQAFAWPARGRISGVFGSQRVYRGEPGSFHSGVDVAAGAGAPVVAPADGVVVLAGPPMFSLEGNLVILDHGSGLNSALLHLATVAVHEGQRVRQGEAIGTVGASGRATGPHLHWGMKWKDARIDPALVAGPMR
jgi:murein DD-endopeptidase MepM/ murein hydrolase activator NlpD